MFVNRLTISLTLRIGGEEHAIPAGNVKSFHLALRPWGFEGEAVFWKVSQSAQSEDRVFEGFMSDVPIEVTFSVDRTFDKAGKEVEPIHLQGVVEGRTVFERGIPDIEGVPVLHRRYAVSFRDKAAVYWSTHHPLCLLVDASYETLVRQETPSGMAVTCDWTSAKSQRPMLSLGLGADSRGTSFYDFLFWLAAREGFGVFYDLKRNSYALSELKPEATPEEIPLADVHEAELRLEQPPRHTVRVMNGAVEAQTRQKLVANPRAFPGIRRDALLVSPIPTELDVRTSRERKTVESPPSGLRVQFARYPSLTMQPQGIYQVDVGGSETAYLSKKQYRLRSLDIDAKAQRQAATDDTDDLSNVYELDIVAEFESTSDPRFSLREYPPLSFPFHVEGTVVSDVGETEEETFQAFQDASTKLDYHMVMVPLWQKKIPAPYYPNLLSGHFYFPPYRGQRVLLALFFEHATIDRFLDWRPGARLPRESQGNHLLLGKKVGNQTSVRHVYENSKPVLTVERRFEVDVQTIRVAEGQIRLETRAAKK